MSLQHFMPVHLITGPEVVKNNRKLFSSLGKKCLIVTGHSSAKRCGALQDVTDALEQEGISWQLFDKIGQNPLVSVCEEGGKAARTFGADFLVGIGGGSPLDATKAIAVFATNEIVSEQIYQPHPQRALPFILVGTTAGTGSEVTRIAVLTDANGQKRSMNEMDAYAQYAFGDPKYTYSLGRDFTISTALDAASHCIESYFGNLSDDINASFAMAGLAKLAPALRSLLEQDGPPSEAVREQLYEASIFGGLAINKTGCCFCHLMGYVLTERHHMPHGLACAVFLPDFIDIAVREKPEKAAVLFHRIGLDAQQLKALICTLTQVKVPYFSDEEIEALLERWSTSANITKTPGNFTVEKQRAVAKHVLQQK